MVAECLRSSKLLKRESLKVMSDSESNSEVPSNDEKLKLLQHYRKEYRVKYPLWPNLALLRRRAYAYCTRYRCSDFGIGHSEIADIAEHVKMSKHTAKTVDSGPLSRIIINFFIDCSGKDLSVIHPEVMFTDFHVEQNIPLFPPHIPPPYGRRLRLIPLFHFEMLACLYLASVINILTEE